MRQSPLMPFGSRAMTLPEISGMLHLSALLLLVILHPQTSKTIILIVLVAEAGNFRGLFQDSNQPSNIDAPMTFLAPELPEETLLEVCILLWHIC